MAPSTYEQHAIPTSSYKRARPVVPAIPASVAWLEHTALEMTATANKSLTHCSTEYLLHVHYRTNASTKPQSWQVSRSFDEYVAFQQRLLKTLSYGHACSAECRWLHSFAKKYFPKKTLLFGNCSTTTMNQRREKLIRYVNVLRSSLLNRGNHGCAIVVNGLANEFTAFIQGDHHIVAEHDEEDECMRRCSMSSMSSSISTSSTDAGDEHHIGDLDSVCDLCHGHLDNSASSTDSSTDSPCHLDGYACDTTTLSCGHQFHDGCVLPQLVALDYCCPSCNEPQV